MNSAAAIRNGDRRMLDIMAPSNCICASGECGIRVAVERQPGSPGKKCTDLFGVAGIRRSCHPYVLGTRLVSASAQLLVSEAGYQAGHVLPGFRPARSIPATQAYGT